jgi:hypothetical protein
MPTAVEQAVGGELDAQWPRMPVLLAQVLAARAGRAVIDSGTEAATGDDAQPPQDVSGAHPPAADGIGL